MLSSAKNQNLFECQKETKLKTSMDNETIKLQSFGVNTIHCENKFSITKNVDCKQHFNS